ncbi:hypothetical protein Tco_0209329 [Tanacetum coccineum]
MAAVVMVAWVHIPVENRDRLFDHVRSHLALPTVPIVHVALESGAGSFIGQRLELEPDGLHLQLLSYKRRKNRGLSQHGSLYTDLDLIFLALGGISITLLAKVYYILSRYYFLLCGITFVVVSETAKRISSKWSDTFLTGDG